MPLSLRRGVVTYVVERHPELVRLEVDGIACVAYPRLTGPVEVGDDVLVNEQARLLALGSGGFDVLHSNLTRGLGLPVAEGAHVMTLPYTPLQAAARHVEEEGPLADDLGGLPVVCCSLHSQVTPAAAGASAGPGGLRTGRGRGASRLALGCGARAEDSWAGRDRRRRRAVPRRRRPVGDDRLGARLGARVGLRRGRVLDRPGNRRHGDGTRARRPRRGGSRQYDGGARRPGRARAAAVARRSAGTPLRPFASHRVRAQALPRRGASCVATRFRAADELDVEEVDVAGWEDACDGLPLSHMGRGPADDPWFFASAFAGGRLARSSGGQIPQGSVP